VSSEHWLVTRMRAANLSVWELGDLLGVHPHVLERSETHVRIPDLPAHVLVELAARLDLHPADLLTDFDAVLTNHRQPIPTETPATPPDTTDISQVGTSEAAAGDPDEYTNTDADVVLVALMHGGIPLSVVELATALSWSLDRTQAAVDHARHHPERAGPVVLRRVPPQSWTVGARLDRLTPDQHQAVVALEPHRVPITPTEAALLLAVLNNQRGPSFTQFRDAQPAAEQELARAGVLTADGDLRGTPETLYSLRYRPGPDR
jgi:hypothetical protein